MNLGADVDKGCDCLTGSLHCVGCEAAGPIGLLAVFGVGTYCRITWVGGVGFGKGFAVCGLEEGTNCFAPGERVGLIGAVEGVNLPDLDMAARKAFVAGFAIETGLL